MPSCPVEQAGKECNDILDDRLSFDVHWTVQEKIHWCKSAMTYIQCAGKYITNCSIIEVQDDVEQLSNFMEHIIKQANRNCHGRLFIDRHVSLIAVFFSGGLYGCEQAVTDVRCIQSAKNFYQGEMFDSGSHLVTFPWYSFLSLALLLLL